MTPPDNSQSDQPAQQPNVQPPADDPDLTIVGIGTSAGGLNALKQFCETIPTDSGVAYVIVIHLSPEQKSYMAELLQPHCPIPVQQVTEDTELKLDYVYVIPPASNLDTIDTHLRLSKLEQRKIDRAPIDHFFRTLAGTHDGHAVGVILTGAGSDGTLGLRRIKEQGGLTIAQDPEEAEYDGMPRSAVSSGMVDRVLPLREIAEAITRFARVRPRVRLPSENKAIEDDEERILQKIFAQIRARGGQDFTQYKRSTILRRIRRRMQLQHIETLSGYLDFIRRHRQEADDLFNDLLITVTEFFRDSAVFERLEKDVIPALFEGKSAQDRLRVWSVGCSTGEEAYSLAMLLNEEAGRRNTHPQMQVFASDLHEKALQSAREGIYPDEIAADISPERLNRFFVSENEHYRVRGHIREMVVFAPHDLLRDPPFSHLDLIVCRNLLIYLRRDVQDDVISLFHYALKPDGLLLLGPSETIDRSDLFHCEDKGCCLFRKRNVPAREPRLPVFPLTRIPARENEAIKRESNRGEQAPSFGTIHERMVERYAPPSVLVNQEHEVIHSSARAGRYLQMPGGAPTTNLFKLVRQPLQIELRAALHAVHENKAGAQSKPVTLDLEGETRNVIIRAEPALDPDLDGFFLIIFDELPAGPEPEGAAEPDDQSTAAHVRELEAELQITHQRLQTSIEEYETTREEMQSSNEELQSANEELRSTMEELETSREELQSMNEELSTLNQEHQERAEELTELTNDLQNLLDATDIATLFLDRELRIVRFTPKVHELFNVRHTDRGRPLTDITHHLGYDTLSADAGEVLDKLTPFEREIQSEAGDYYLVRILPYRTAEDRINGVVLTFIDITQRKQAEQEVADAKDYAEKIIETLHEPLLVLTPELVVKSVNPAFFEHFNVEPHETIGRKIYNLGNGQWDIPSLRDLLENVLPADKVFADYEVAHEFENIGQRVMLLNARRLDHVHLILLGIRDITDSKQHERMRIVMSELNHRAKNTLATIDAIAQQTIRHSNDLEEFSKAFCPRLRSLAAAHSLLSRAEWSGAMLRDILRAELEHRVPTSEHLVLDGPKVQLSPRAVLTLHMVVHELTTNASKYGALSKPEGRIHVSWQVTRHDDGDQVELNWKELNGPSVDEPERKGFGSRLIHEMIEYELDGQTQRTFEADGLHCRIVFPLSEAVGSVQPYRPPTYGEIIAESSPRTTSARTPQRPKQRVSTVLVVEDNHAIARSLTVALEEAECNIIGPIGTLKEATRIAAEVSVDAVLMDVDLGGERVYPLARELRDRKIPFALLTGFGAEDLPPDLREGAIFPKPIDLEAVFNWLRIDPTS